MTHVGYAPFSLSYF